jgi:NitT/TauT family transport system permease protein
MAGVIQGKSAGDKPLLSTVLRKLTPFVGILAFLAVWEVMVAVVKAPAYLLPAPSVIFETFVREFPKLAYHGWVTLYEMLLGYGLALVVGVPLAIAITSSERFDRFSMPTLLFFQVVPRWRSPRCSWCGSASAPSPRCWSRSSFPSSRS